MVRGLHFRRMTADDLPLLDAWLQRDHVRKWWGEPEGYEAVVDHYLPAIEGRDPTDLYLIVLDDLPVGFVETYLVSDYPDHEARVGVGEGVAGVDLFIAEEELTGQGLGTDTLRAFTREIVFARLETVACIADPDGRNTQSIRAFEKAGFRRVGKFFDPTDGAVHALVRLERPSGAVDVRLPDGDG